MRISTLAGAAILAAVAEAKTGRTFAVNHFYGKGPLMEGRVDPIVNAGGPSGHVHTIQGGNAFKMTMGDLDAVDGSTCTSSLVKNDKSNYWTPKLYFQNTDGTLQDVELFYMNVYYFFEGTNDKIVAFPPGLRMLVGNPSLRTPPATGGKPILDLADGTPSPVSWTCPRSNPQTPLYPTNSDGLHGVGIQDPGNKGSGVGFPDKYCDGYASPLRADIHFPSCYNPDEKTGGGLHNYKTNTVFPTHGDCPAGWWHLPHLFYEVYWNTPKFSGKWTQGQGKQPFVLSNGDPTGYSLHADFLAGWDEKTLQQIIDNCDAGDAGMDKCPGLIGGLNDPSDSCNLQSPVQETIFGTMSALPGKNPVGQWGVNVPAPAPGSSSAAPPASSQAPAPPASSKPATSPKPSTTAGGVKPTTKPTVYPTTKPSVKPTTPPAASTPASTAKPTGKPGTLVTSYVSETTVVWTTVTAPIPAATGGNSVQAGWGYKGCFSDTKTGERVLSGIKFANIGNHQVTNTKCVAYCDSKGFSMAGTEYGGQCFCGNALSGSSPVAEAKCNMPCEGNDKETCGGSLTLSVYSKSKKRRVSRHLHAHVHNLA